MASDRHICLICNVEIDGLYNYIHHKQNQCDNSNEPIRESTVSACDEFVCSATNSSLEGGAVVDDSTLVKLEPVAASTIEEKSIQFSPVFSADLLSDGRIHKVIDTLDLRSFYKSLKKQSLDYKRNKNEQTNFCDVLHFMPTNGSEKQRELLEIWERCMVCDVHSMFVGRDFDGDEAERLDESKCSPSAANPENKVVGSESNAQVGPATTGRMVTRLSAGIRKPSRYSCEGAETFPKKPSRVEENRPPTGGSERGRGSTGISLHPRRRAELATKKKKKDFVDSSREDEESWSGEHGSFQCRPCKYRSDCVSQFEDHVADGSAHAVHVETMTGSLMCVWCGFSCRPNREMVDHLSTDAHKRTSERKVVEGKPSCVLKESSYRVECIVCFDEFRSTPQFLTHLGSPCWSKTRIPDKRTPRSDAKVGSSDSLPASIRKRKRGRPPKNSLKKKESTQVSEGQTNGNVSSLSSEPVGRRTNVEPPLLREPSSSSRKRGVKRRSSRNISSAREDEDADEFVLKLEDNEAASADGVASRQEEKFWCRICGLGFCSQEKLIAHKNARTHLRKVEEMKSGDGKNYRCQRCGRIFYALNALQFHELNHQLGDAWHSKPNDLPAKGRDSVKKEKQDAATVPEEVDSRCLALYNQLKAECEDDVKKVLCPECGKMLTKAGILSHLRLHAGSLPYKCTFCLKQFADVAVMRRHLKVHLGIMYYKCPVCSKQFNRKLTMQNHALREHGADAVEKYGVLPPNHQCSQCGRQFIQLSQLTAHMKLHDKQLKCPHSGCTSLFRYRSELAVHLQTHSTERRFLCDECGYSGKSRHQLKRHQRLHAGDKRYRCNSCDYKTTLAANLRRHERVHTGSKPYKCLYCGYSCNTQENLRKHILKTRRHAGKSVYPCQLCQFATNSAQDFQRHLETSHQHDRQTLPSVLVGMYQPDDKKKNHDSKSAPNKSQDADRRSAPDPGNAGEKRCDGLETPGGTAGMAVPPRESPMNPLSSHHDLLVTAQNCQKSQDLNQQLVNQIIFANLTAANSSLQHASAPNHPSSHSLFPQQTSQNQNLLLTPPPHHTAPQTLIQATNQMQPSLSPLDACLQVQRPLIMLPQLSVDPQNFKIVLQLIGGRPEESPVVPVGLTTNGSCAIENNGGLSDQLLLLLRASNDKQLVMGGGIQPGAMDLENQKDACINLEPPT